MKFKASIKMENSAMMDADDVAESIVGSLPSISGAKKKGTFSNRRGEPVGDWKISEEPDIEDYRIGAPDWTVKERADDGTRCYQGFYDSDGDEVYECTRRNNHNDLHVNGDGNDIDAIWSDQ